MKHERLEARRDAAAKPIAGQGKGGAMIAMPIINRLKAVRLRGKEAGPMRRKAPERPPQAAAPPGVKTSGLIDLPMGKALVAAETDGKTPCADRCFCKGDFALCKMFACVGLWRGDGKDVVFKLVDCPARGSKWRGR